MASDRIVLKRDVLYREVWAEPVSKVSARYEITGVTLTKICRKLEVPTPDRTYWMPRECG
jgi:hypothetical protein